MPQSGGMPPVEAPPRSSGVASRQLPPENRPREQLRSVPLEDNQGDVVHVRLAGVELVDFLFDLSDDVNGSAFPRPAKDGDESLAAEEFTRRILFVRGTITVTEEDFPGLKGYGFCPIRSPLEETHRAGPRTRSASGRRASSSGDHAPSTLPDVAHPPSVASGTAPAGRRMRLKSAS